MSTGNRGGPLFIPAPPPRPISTIAVNSSISSLLYYHPNLSDMEQVKQFLAPYMHVEGSFILRNSISKPGFFTLTVTHSTGLRHINVEMSSTPMYYLKDIKFETMDQLVKYYSVESVPNKQKISGVRLLNPIMRTFQPQPMDLSYQQWQQLQLPQQHTPAVGIRVPGQEDMYINPVEIEPICAISLASATGSDAAQLRQSKDIPVKANSNGVSRDHYKENPSAFSSKKAELVAKLSLEDEVKRCDCGLLVEDAMLPRGWSVHLCQHPSSLGKIYFMSPEGRCQWTLPLRVSLELTATQQDLIRDLIHDFETKTNRTAREKSIGSPGFAGFPETVPPPPSTQDHVFHDVCVWAMASDDANYVQLSSPELLQGVSEIGSNLSNRSTLFSLSPSALASVSNNEDSTSDEPDNSDYMKMDGSHLRKD